MIVRRLALLLAVVLVLGIFGGCGGAAEVSGAGASAAEASAGTELAVHCFQAGAADAILLTTLESTVLIDCGEKGFGQTILDYLADKGVTAIDYLIITHFDQDHVGGAAKVINNIPVKTVLQSNCPKDSAEYEKYLTALGNAGMEAQTVTETLTFTLGGVRYTVDPPRSVSYQSDESNNSSLIVTVENGADRLLFLGDAMTERLEEYLAANPGPADFMKVAHHGREEPLLGELLSRVQPACAVITSSREEPEDAAVVAMLENAGTEVFLTRQGAVDLRSTGSGVTAVYSE